MTASTSAASQPPREGELVEFVRTGPHALPPRPEESPRDAASRAAEAARRLPAPVPVRHLPPRPPLPDEAPPSASDDADSQAGEVRSEDVSPPEPEISADGSDAGDDAAQEVAEAELEPADAEVEPAEAELEPADAEVEPAEVVTAAVEIDPVAYTVDAAAYDLLTDDTATDETAEEEPAPEGIAVDESVAEEPIASGALTDAGSIGVAESVEAGSHDADAEAVEALAHVFDDSLDEAPEEGVPALRLRGVSKAYGRTRAVDAIDLTVPAGTFYGIVGPNGAGKTTTLSMITGLLRPDEGEILVSGVDARRKPLEAKSQMGVLPDRLRTFDRLTGRQLLYYYGTLRGLAPSVVESRTADLARAFDLTSALGRVVSDYSAGMTKKVMLAGAMIHAPRVLVLDEPFEAVDPVSSAVILDILRAYVAHGGTVVLSSHGMELVESVCSRVAVIVAGQVLAEGTVERVRGELTLEQRFVELAGGLSDVEGLEWLHTYSD